MKANLILKCEGRVDNGFAFCAGVSNTILDCSTITHTVNYRQLIEYLDTSAGLFEGPVFNGNIIMNTMAKLFELGYITEELHKRLIHFFQWHRYCGIYMRLEPK